jgi:quercetin dioxygenase-like cupin family protein
VITASPPMGSLSLAPLAPTKPAQTALLLAGPNMPKGKVQDWHNPAHRQYVVTRSGRGEVEIAGGQKILLSPGRVVLLENVTGKGHITRSKGSEDLTFFIVPLAVR